MRWLLIIWLVWWAVPFRAQTFRLSGHVRDTAGQSLAYANIIADGQDINDVQYTVSNSQGQYFLKLSAHKTYRITVTYLGFRPVSFRLTMHADSVHNVVMQPGAEKLDKVVITYKPPVKILEDTVTYAADKFRTGEERKLRQVLEKLPGMEVTENGQIFFNGKKVKRVLVEKKTFFTGETSLALDHIPADAVEDIQMIDNYQEVGYMKQFEQSDELVMNIKLKKDKKRFYFGDLEGGAGWEKRAIARPSLFYYSPERQWQGLAEWNNTGRNDFNASDYYKFEGQSVLRSLWQNRYRAPLDRDLMQLLANRNNYHVEHALVATHWLETIGKHLELKAYVIGNRTATAYEHIIERYYLIPPDSLGQHETSDRLSRIVLGVVRGHYQTAKGDVFIRLTGKYFRPCETGTTNFNTLASIHKLEETQESMQKFFGAETEWFRRLGFDDVFHFYARYTLKAPFTYQHSWQSDSLMDLPFVSDDTLRFTQLQNSRYLHQQSSEFSMRLFHVVNSKWHVYLSAGGSWQNLLVEEDTGIFEDSIGILNSTQLQTGMQWERYGFYGMAEVKTQFGKSILRAGIRNEMPAWNIRAGEQIIHYNETLLLPRFSFRIKWTDEKLLNFTYSRDYRYPSYEDLIPGFYVTDPTYLFRGNPDLKPALYDNFKLRMSYFAYFRHKWIVSLMGNYKKYRRNIRYITHISDGQMYREPYLSYEPERIWSVMTYMMKEWGRFRITIRGIYSDNKYYMRPGGYLSAYRVQSISMGIGLRYRATPSGDWRISMSGSESWINGLSQTLLSYHIKPSVKQRLTKGLYVQSSMDWQYQTGAGQHAGFNLWDVSTMYHDPDSPWTFEVQIFNILNTAYKTLTSTEDIYITTQSLRTFPRMTVAKVIYSF